MRLQEEGGTKEFSSPYEELVYIYNYVARMPLCGTWKVFVPLRGISLYILSQTNQKEVNVIISFRPLTRN